MRLRDVLEQTRNNRNSEVTQGVVPYSRLDVPLEIRFVSGVSRWLHRAKDEGQVHFLNVIRERVGRPWTLRCLPHTGQLFGYEFVEVAFGSVAVAIVSKEDAFFVREPARRSRWNLDDSGETSSDLYGTNIPS